MSWLFMIIPEFYNDTERDMLYYFILTNQLSHILYSRLLALLLFMFLCIRCMAARIYKNLSADLSLCLIIG